MNLTKILTDINENRVVKKLIFEDDNAISEVVAYAYEDRCVICFSCQSGCPVGCIFCGTGKKFIRDLSSAEMKSQIEIALKEIHHNDFTKHQLMAMSMGEPMLNFNQLFTVAKHYLQHDNFDFFISTVGINNEAQFSLTELFKYSRFGLQVSLHEVDEEKRKQLLGNYPYLLSFKTLKYLSRHFNKVSGKKVYYNLIVDRIYDFQEMEKLKEIIDNNHLTLSVKSSITEFKNGDLEIVNKFAENLKDHHIYDFSIFNPIGQDTIGGGCGQLLYVQEKLKRNMK